ncbi:MAG TPA: hypothetical protein VHB98_08540 [Chloroflexota bacterium]|jgi:hypothetical protein|nr:hypothetical protein [Chloroflexota bacterium]
MGEIIRLSQDRIHITVYTRARCLSWGQRAAACQLEKERTLTVIRGVVKELGQWYFEVHTRPWAGHFYETIFRGGWCTPIVMVGNTVFSQGCVPDRAHLRTYLNEQIHILRPRLAKSS